MHKKVYNNMIKKTATVLMPMEEENNATKSKPHQGIHKNQAISKKKKQSRIGVNLAFVTWNLDKIHFQNNSLFNYTTIL